MNDQNNVQRDIKLAVKAAKKIQKSECNDLIRVVEDQNADMKMTSDKTFAVSQKQIKELDEEVTKLKLQVEVKNSKELFLINSESAVIELLSSGLNKIRRKPVEMRLRTKIEPTCEFALERVRYNDFCQCKADIKCSPKMSSIPCVGCEFEIAVSSAIKILTDSMKQCGFKATKWIELDPQCTFGSVEIKEVEAKNVSSDSKFPQPAATAAVSPLKASTAVDGPTVVHNGITINTAKLPNFNIIPLTEEDTKQKENANLQKFPDEFKGWGEAWIDYDPVAGRKFGIENNREPTPAGEIPVKEDDMFSFPDDASFKAYSDDEELMKVD